MKRVYLKKLNQYGTFIGLGIMYEELRDGIGHYTTIVVRLEDGNVIEVPSQDVKAVES